MVLRKPGYPSVSCSRLTPLWAGVFAQEGATEDALGMGFFP